jgi:hypothetical protein
MTDRHAGVKTLSASAHLTINLQCRARGVIRDTRASDAKRFLWSVVPSGQLEPIARGRT